MNGHQTDLADRLHRAGVESKPIKLDGPISRGGIGGGGIGGGGGLVGRVAHELNNPLDGLLRYANLALRAGEAGSYDQVKDHLQMIRGGLQRMARITRELTVYARAGHPDGESTTEIHRVVEEAIHSYEHRANEQGVIITASYRDVEMPALPATPVYQVCCNLIKNSLEAMPGGGMLTIHTWMADGRAYLKFEDTGQGFQADPAKLFEPFYTTRADEEGTGLGLAICKELVEGLGGIISAEHGSERGAVFTVQLPISGVPSARDGG